MPLLGQQDIFVVVVVVVVVDVDVVVVVVVVVAIHRGFSNVQSDNRRFDVG